MDKVKILRLCNEIEDIATEIQERTMKDSYFMAQTIINKVLVIAADVNEQPKTNADRIRQMTDAAPTIEPEVRHWRWIPYGRDSSYNSYIRCSHCNHEVIMYADSEKSEPKCCEECGYRMDGGADNG